MACRITPRICALLQLLQYVEDMQGLIVELGLQRLSVVGTSMGGLMTLLIAVPGLMGASATSVLKLQAGLTDQVLRGCGGPVRRLGRSNCLSQLNHCRDLPRLTDAPVVGLARQCYIEREGQIVIDYDTDRDASSDPDYRYRS